MQFGSGSDRRNITPPYMSGVPEVQHVELVKGTEEEFTSRTQKGNTERKVLLNWMPSCYNEQAVYTLHFDSLN